MNYRHLIRTLTTIKRNLRSVLEENAELVIDAAIRDLKDSKEKYDWFQRRKDLIKKPHDWGYEILTPPLRFKMARYKGYTLRPDIICWYPKELDLPRLLHHPLDLLLLCQLVVANFYPNDYEQIRLDSTWRWAVTTVERYLLEEYYMKCLEVIRDQKRMLLDELWN